MTSRRRPLSTAAVLGVLGSAGGILNFSTFTIAFAISSGASSVPNRSLFTLEDALILLGIGGSAVMGMVGAIFCGRYPGRGGAIMIWSACIALLTIGILSSSSLFYALYGPNYGWWAVVLLFGGIFSLRTWMANQERSGTSVGNTGGSQTLRRSVFFQETNR